MLQQPVLPPLPIDEYQLTAMRTAYWTALAQVQHRIGVCKRVQDQFPTMDAVKQYTAISLTPEKGPVKGRKRMLKLKYDVCTGPDRSFWYLRLCDRPSSAFEPMDLTLVEQQLKRLLYQQPELAIPNRSRAQCLAHGMAHRDAAWQLSIWQADARTAAEATVTANYMNFAMAVTRQAPK